MSLHKKKNKSTLREHITLQQNVQLFSREKFDLPFSFVLHFRHRPHSISSSWTPFLSKQINQAEK